MKTKITATLLTLAILFSFAACGKTAADATTSAATTIQTTVQTGGTTTVGSSTEPETSQTQTDASTGADTTANTTVPTTKVTTQATTTVPAVKTFTAAQLAEFNGKNGKNAYIAYEGTVYNVTGPNWVNGVHYVLSAGKDITAAYNLCNKHGSTIFNKYPTVGTYIG